MSDNGQQDPEQLKLSQTCKELLDEWQPIEGIIFDEGSYSEFWTKFKTGFYKQVKKSQEAYNMGFLVETLTDLVSKTEVVWKNMRDYDTAGQIEKRDEANATLLKLLDHVIVQVEKIEAKSLQVEEKRPDKISSNWISQFLTAYYTIITHIAVLDYIIAAMSFQIYPDQVRLSLMHQEDRLAHIRDQIGTLIAPDLPQPLIQHMKTVSEHVANLIDCYKEQLDDAARRRRISTLYSDLKLKEEVSKVYKDSLEFGLKVE
jgi:hypothetical protein